MSNQLTCKDPFGYKPGLEDGNSQGPSPVSNSNLVTKYYAPLDANQIIKISKSITIDSVFASFTLNQQGGNYSVSGYLYEIWFDGYINNDPSNANILNGGKWLFLSNLLTLDTYDLVIIDTQDVNDPTYGPITKVLVADPLYIEELSSYVTKTASGEERYSISYSPLVESGNNAVFPLENNIVRRVNFNAKDLSRIIDRPLLSYSSNTYGSMSIWFESPESVLSYPQLVPGNSLRLESNENPDSGFEVVINGTPTYRGQLNDITPGDVYYSIRFVSGSIGFVAGVDREGRPTVLRTKDSGGTWSDVTPSGLKLIPKSIAFDPTSGPTDYTIFIVGDQGSAYRSDDTGETWTSLDTGTTDGLKGAFALSSDLLWVVGANGTVLFSSDNGDTWSSQTSGVSVTLNSVHFISDTKGWVVGNSGTVIETEDGGLTWIDRTSNSDTTEDLYSVFFTRENRGYACGNNGIIIRTNTTGDTWTIRPSGTTASLRSLSFVTSSGTDVGVAVGLGGVVVRTNDGGISWNASNVGGYGSFYSNQMLSSTTVWASGDDTYIKRSTNAGASWTSSIPPNTPLNLNKVVAGSKIKLNLVAPYQYQYTKGDVVYISKTIIDIKSGNFGNDYVKALVLSFDAGVLEAMVSFKPDTTTASGSKWYIISEVDQINIPISDNYYFSLLNQSEILQYNVLNCVFSVRLQIEETKVFDRYVFRYKPENSSFWRYVVTTESNTIIENVIPNTVFDEEIMGFNDSTTDYCGFSETGVFNTFF